MCKIIKVDKSSYYHWIKAGRIVKKVDTKLNNLIKAIFIQGRNNYGTRRIADKLKKTIWSYNIKKKNIYNYERFES